MPDGGSWTAPQPYLVFAAAALSAHRYESSARALAAAEGMLERVPAGQEAPGRLAAALIRLAASRRTGDLTTAAAAACCAEALLSQVPVGELAQHPEIQARVLSGRGAVELWSGHLDEAARVLEAAGAAVPGGDRERADCLGHLALVEALRGRLHSAAKLAGRAAAAAGAEEQPSGQHPAPAALVALAWVHLERNELRGARNRLRQADAALGASPDRLIESLACLVVACACLSRLRAARSSLRSRCTQASATSAAGAGC